jgi:hypothetical protein
MVKKEKWFHFKAAIYSIGVNRCVDIPGNIGKAFGTGKHIPVKGTIRNLTFESTLMSRGGGNFRLFIHSSIWKKLDVDNGDTISINIRPANAPEDLAVPDDIMESLLRNEKALEIFNSLTTRSRNSYIEFINKAKTPETRERRLVVGIERLLERKKKVQRAK